MIVVQAIGMDFIPHGVGVYSLELVFHVVLPLHPGRRLLEL